MISRPSDYEEVNAPMGIDKELATVEISCPDQSSDEITQMLLTVCPGVEPHTLRVKTDSKRKVAYATLRRGVAELLTKNGLFDFGVKITQEQPPHDLRTLDLGDPIYVVLNAHIFTPIFLVMYLVMLFASIFF
eukprot:GHVU01127872.1.p3 GENE.GHVU01127872.1~~GHVU01127872.1.p3  ORF type:complete len:133 (-),score=15.44 GHVU01127872.1:371-769(-)